MPRKATRCTVQKDVFVNRQHARENNEHQQAILYDNALLSSKAPCGSLQNPLCKLRRSSQVHVSHASTETAQQPHKPDTESHVSAQLNTFDACCGENRSTPCTQPAAAWAEATRSVWEQGGCREGFRTLLRRSAGRPMAPQPTLTPSSNPLSQPGWNPLSFG